MGRVIKSVSSMAGIMGLLMVPNKSWIFLAVAEERWTDRHMAVLGRQPHLLPPEAVSW